jgi:S-(hydroxymethyl)glutathione dehydrogenase / alcohol dehydrogenase
MKTRAAVLWGLGQPWKVEEIDLGAPRDGTNIRGVIVFD